MLRTKINLHKSNFQPEPVSFFYSLYDGYLTLPLKKKWMDEVMDGENMENLY